MNKQKQGLETIQYHVTVLVYCSTAPFPCLSNLEHKLSKEHFQRTFLHSVTSSVRYKQLGTKWLPQVPQDLGNSSAFHSRNWSDLLGLPWWR